ncbi:MAG: DEAD/DEAH box helicase [Candidatus Paceibacterota bacterium]
MTKEQKTTEDFNNLQIKKEILNILTKKGFTEPMPIQHQVIPAAIEGKDVVGIAQTGTGKTLAFVVPMIQKILTEKAHGLVLVPTRELAIQVEREFKLIGRELNVRSTVIIGGVPQYRQAKEIKNNPDVIIATPGRLVDLINQKILKLNQIDVITLDEADRMLDQGFLPEIKKVLHLISKKRQMMLFSATMPKSISSLASHFMKLPLRVEIAPQGTSAENIEQELFIVGKNDKMRLLDSILQKYKSDIVLIFSRTRHGTKRIAKSIRHMGHTATEIHSDRSQNQRKSAIEGFINGKFRIMVATDIASRGIDVKDISLVVNFDLPDNSEDYVHRIGRTGRAGRYGKAISFVTSPQKRDVKKIERLMDKSLPVMSLPELPPARKVPNHSNSNKFSKSKYRGKKKGRYSKGRNRRGGNNKKGGRRRNNHY